MLQLVNVACEIIRTSIMRAEEFTREAKTGAVDQLCCSTAEVLLQIPKSTNGSMLVQCSGCGEAFRADLRCLWNHSTSPLAMGW